MPDLSAAGLASWASRLPPDLRSAVANAPGVGDAGEAGERVARLGAGPPGEALAEILSDEGLARALGQAGRIRVAAWLVAEAGPGWAERSQVVALLTGERAADADGDEGGGDGVPGAVGAIFLEDLRRLNAALAARIAARTVDRGGLAASADAAMAYEAETLVARGGMP